MGYGLTVVNLAVAFFNLFLTSTCVIIMKFHVQYTCMYNVHSHTHMYMYTRICKYYNIAHCTFQRVLPPQYQSFYHTHPMQVYTQSCSLYTTNHMYTCVHYCIAIMVYK